MLTRLQFVVRSAQPDYLTCPGDRSFHPPRMLHRELGKRDQRKRRSWSASFENRSTFRGSLRSRKAFLVRQRRRVRKDRQFSILVLDVGGHIGKSMTKAGTEA